MIIEAPVYELVPPGPCSSKVKSVQEGIRRKTMFGEKDALAICFETEKLGKDGQKLSVLLYANRTIGKRSSLAKYIRQITGKDPGQRFDPQSLVGMQVVIVVEHSENAGRTYANVVHISRTANVHGVDITDEDVQFPGGNAVSA